MQVFRSSCSSIPQWEDPKVEPQPHETEQASPTLPTAINTDNGGSQDRAESLTPSDSRQSVTPTLEDQAEAETGTVASDVPSTGESQDPTLPKVIHLPAATETMDDFLHTEVFDSDKVSHQLPPSEVDSSTFDPLQATEVLKSVGPGTAHLPVGAGGMAVDPQAIRDSVVTTQFSMHGAAQVGKELEEDSGEKPEGEEDFPTFDKWSVQYLAEQEKQKIVKEQEQAVNPSSPLGQKKLRQNFAAASCGAKVVGSNAEAENINFLLNGNPDEYMLSPCKAKKWFVVELCEPLQIHKVELGTMELFSSQPKSFRVFSSQRYPTKEWTPLGKFEMTRDRVVQSFHTQVNDDFVKFVKVEMVEHHGDEHYCPLTTFRVLGIDMASDEEDETEQEAAEPYGEGQTDNNVDDEVEESVNLFTSAKETVVKLVKKVLYKGDSETQAEEGKDAEEGEHPPSDNATTKTEAKKGESGEAKPCPEKSGAAPGPTAQVPDAGVIPPPVPVVKEPEEIPIVTKLADTEQLPMDTTQAPIVVKLEQEQEDENSHLCFHSPLSSYAALLAYRPPSASTCMAMVKPPKPVDSQTTSDTKDNLQPTKIRSVSTIEVTPAEEKTSVQEKESTVPEDSRKSSEAKQEPIVSESSGDMSQESSKVPVDKSTDQKPLTASRVVEIDRSSQQHQQPPDRMVVSSESTTFTSAGVSATSSESLEPSSLSTQADLGQEAVSMGTPGLHIQQSQVVEHGGMDLSETLFLKVSPSPTLGSEDSVGAEGDLLQQPPTASDELKELKVDEGSKVSTDAESSLNPPSPSTETKTGDAATPEAEKSEPGNATAPNTGKPVKPVDLVKVGVGSSAKRDTSLMKLNNRIVALEQNVSMTKKYLEELSRAFKQQNEDMMKLLNKTEKRLSNYMAQAEERALRQQAHIEVLEQKVANLTAVVDAMQTRMDTMGKELHDRQLLLAFVELILFAWLMISSLRGQVRPAPTPSDHQFLLDTMPSKPTIKQSEEDGRRRRNSDVGITSGTDQIGLAMKRQRSDTSLATNDTGKEQTLMDNLSLAGMTQASKKKKKKKVKHHHATVESSSALVSSGSPTQCSSFSSSAGVLFGTASRLEPPQATSQTNGACPNLPETGDENQLSLPSNWSENLPQESVMEHLPQPLTLNPLLFPGFGHTPHCPQNVLSRVPDYRAGLLAMGGQYPLLYQSPCLACGSQSVPTCLSSLSNSPLDQTSIRKSSPEYQVPLYHRKVRKLGDMYTNSSSGANLRDSKGNNVSKDTADGRHSTGFMNSKSGESFFLAENYLSENRFKFPSSPAGDTVTELDHWPHRSSDHDLTNLSYAGVGPSDERYPPLLTCPSKRFQTPPSISTTASTGVQRSSFLSSNSSSASSVSASSQRSPPLTSSFIPFDHITTHPSFTSIAPSQPPAPPRPPPPLPLTLAQLSSQNVPRPSSALTKKDLTQHPQPPASSTSMLESGPVVSSAPNNQLTNHLPAGNDTVSNNQIKRGAMKEPTSPPGSAGKSNVNHTRGEDYKSTNSYQTHRRQGSLPLDPHRINKGAEKDQSRFRQGSLDGPPQGSKPRSGNQQGSKMKKAPSHPALTHRGSASKNRPHP